MIQQRPMTEIRSDDDRSDTCMEFLAAVTAVCKEYGYAIGHQDEHGAFYAYKFESAEELEPNLEWFQAADEVKWLVDISPTEPPEPDPFAPSTPPKDPF